MEKHFLRKLKKIAGKEHVFSETEDLIAYSGDASLVAGRPEDVVHPASAEQVAAIVEAAAEAGVPLVPRGSGTGLSGGSVAVSGGIVLHFDRMNRRPRIDESMHDQTGGRALRNVSGYDLTALITGSEGTLGIITGITLKLLPKPASRSAKTPYMSSAHSPAELGAMLRIKQALDPSGIMNPGKIFPGT